jgi:hypothetical protein
VTRPFALTVAIVAVDVVHSMVRFDNALPLASRAVADNCVVWPTRCHRLGQRHRPTQRPAVRTSPRMQQSARRCTGEGAQAGCDSSWDSCEDACEVGRPLKPARARVEVRTRDRTRQRGLSVNVPPSTVSGGVESVECARRAADAYFAMTRIHPLRRTHCRR